MTLGEGLTNLSYLVGAGVFAWAAKRKKLATEGMAVLAGIGFAAGIAGAKLTQVLASGLPATAALQPQIGGRALLGGLVFGWVAVEIAKWRMGIRRSTGDLFALALPAGEAVGRIGCYFNGCCYGEKSGVPWAVWQHDAWRHPAQLYSSATALAIFGTLLWLDGRKLREGDLFRAYLLLFGVTRFGLEFVRWRESTLGGLSPMQWFCLDLIVIASIGLLRRKRNDLPQLRPQL